MFAPSPPVPTTSTHLGQTVLDVETALAHRARRADDLVDVLRRLHGERDEQSGALGRRELAVHDRADQLGALGLRKTIAGYEPAQERRVSPSDARALHARDALRARACRGLDSYLTSSMSESSAASP